MNNVIDKARALWSKEQIRVLVIVSLAIQVVLIVFAPFRKRSGNKLLLFLLWSMYLGADYIATLALGSILAHTMDDAFGGNSGKELTGQNLVAFWAPFLLLHMGGPDNITSYSIEDNELWLRHLFSLVAEVSTALVVFVMSKVQSTSLLVPSIFIFVVGTIKFGERTFALFSATMEQIRRSIRKNESDRSKVRALQPKDTEFDDNSDADFIVRGYISFLCLRAHMASTTDANKLLVNWHEKKVFKEIGIELSFFHDILHTKAIPVHSFWGRVVRLTSLVSILIALTLFHVNEKRGDDSSDVIITYILLSMALFLEIYSILLLVASNWTTISLFLLEKKWARDLAEYISRSRNRVFWAFWLGKKQCWSGQMGQYGLIQSNVKTWVREKEGRNIIWVKIENAWGFLFGDKRAEVSDILEKMMINHVRNLVATVMPEGNRDLARKLRSSWISNTLAQHNLSESEALMREKSFEECVIAWHVATEMFYFSSNQTDDNRDTEQGAIYKVSKYMMHLLMEQPSMMPPGIAKVTVEETLEDIRFILHDNLQSMPRSEYVKHVFECLLKLKQEDWTSDLYAESVCPWLSQLLVDLRKIGRNDGVEIGRNNSGEIGRNDGEKRQWEVIRDAWMEMLTFAALRCSTTEHAKGLSRGGELLTHYWLLLAHNHILEDFDYHRAGHYVIDDLLERGIGRRRD